MVVLSLFDGMSCGQIALNKIGKKPSVYYASEIDKYAQIVSKANYPNTIYLGDVRNVNVKELKHINLLIGGSPCQSFSFAGKRKGMSTKDNIEILTIEHYLELKEQQFEFEGQSYLFWEYMRILNDIRKYNPDVKFLLENVIMGDKWQKVLTRAIGINPILINSALLSAQNRERLYWTNIGAEQDGFFGDLFCKIPQPKDKGILLKDILEAEVDEKYYLSNKMLQYFENRAANFNNGKVNIRNESGKATTLTKSMSSCDISDNFIKVKANVKNISNNGLICHDIQTMVSVRKYNVDISGLQKCLKEHKNGSIKEIAEKLNVPKTEAEHWFRTDKYFSIPDKNIWYKLKELLKIQTNEFDAQITEFIEKPNEFDIANRAYDDVGKNPTLTSASEGNLIVNESRIRRLTPLECERLQTVPDNYTNHVSDTQRYKMLGNGWTVDVIAHIFKYLS